MRQQAKELVAGRVYADIKDDSYEPVFMRFVKYVSDEIAAFSYVSGSKIYPTNQKGFTCFLSSQGWYELTPADEKKLNPPLQSPDIPRLVALAIDKCREKMDFVEVDIEDNGWKFEADAYYNGGDVYFEEVRISPIWDDKFNKAFVG